VFDREERFALRVLSDGHAVHFEGPQLHLNTSCVVDGFDHSVDRSIGGLLLGDDAAVGMRQPDGDARRLVFVRCDAQRLQRPGPASGSERMTNASMSPSKSSFFLSANALNASNS
jgi:hypothetical protein